MAGWYGYDAIQVSRDSLLEFAWSAPMRTLAAKVGMSDVGLKKMLATYDVFPPPQGYWNKLAAGKLVPDRPVSPERKPGQAHYAMVDKRLGKFVPVMPLPSHEGPFFSRFVPEDLEQLYQAELKACGQVKPSRDLANPHIGIKPVIAGEERRRLKKLGSPYSWTDGSLFDNPFDKRRLRILNGLFQALTKREAAGRCTERDADLDCSVIVGDMSVSISIDSATQKKVHGYSRTSRYADLPANTKLRLTIGHHWKSGDAKTWIDNDKGTVEQSLNEVAASIIMLGEAGYRASLKERADREDQARQAAEVQRRKRLAEAEGQRIEQLKKSGELLRQAGEIRSLVSLVRDAAGELNIEPSDLENWEQWAQSYADRIDPVKSGQVLQHLKAPTLDEM